MYRIKNCEDISFLENKKKIIICGWVEKIRKLKENYFIILRDRYNKVQLVFSFKNNYFLKVKIKNLNLEDCIIVYGLVNEFFSKDIISCKEISVFDFYVISKALFLPLQINNTNNSEEMKLRFRCLDLRRESIKKNIINKHKIYSIIFNFFNENNFLYIDTPNLIKFTPFGANNFIVPSSKNNYYFSLAESPQIFKQLLMISCYDKYFQFSKCFRNENLRKDRQPEFVQIDFEMSFVDIEDILDMVEKLFYRIFCILFNINIKTPFNKISYDDCINFYGTDKPDLRCDFFFIDFLNYFSLNQMFKIFFFIENIKLNSFFKCILIKKDYQNYLLKLLNLYNLEKKILIIKKKKTNWEAVVRNFDFKNENLDFFSEFYEVKDDDYLLILFGNDIKIINKILFDIRSFFINNVSFCSSFNFIWVLEFPLFNYEFFNNTINSIHHPFTKPIEYFLNDFSSINKIKSKSYDLVINGTEIGGGSIRINNFFMQDLIFKLLDLNKNIIGQSFEFFINSLKISPPPHGGMAIGIDRLCMLLFNTESIREFIVFPKSLSGFDLFFNCPIKDFF